MKAKLELYRVFKAVAEAGNISAAAKTLYISQSAISQAIKQLETQLETQLFLRTPRGVTLTNGGELLYGYISNGLNLIQSGEDRLAQISQLVSGELVIGASDTVTKRFLLPILQRFHQDYPQLKLRIVNGTSTMVLDYLQSGAVDLAFATSPIDEGEYNSIRCFDNHYIFVASPEYDCDFSHRYSLQEISQFPLIMLERKASSRIYLENFFLQHGVRLQPEIELGSHNLLIALARIGLGVAAVTEEFAQSGLIRGVICPLRLDTEIPTRFVGMCTLKKVQPTVATLRFMQYICQQL